VGQNAAKRNEKAFRSCAEAVDGESSLWNAEEIGGITRKQRSRNKRRESDRKFRQKNL